MDQQFYISVFVVYLTIQNNPDTSSDKTTVFHAWPCGRFTEIQSSLRAKNFTEQLKAPIFSEAVSTIEIMYQPQSKLEEKFNSSILKEFISSRTDLSSFTSVLLNQSNETSRVFSTLKSTSRFLRQSTVSLRSDSSLKANSSCCHRSDMG